jgi:GntR family transcriptional regulator, transcriptional repressor for pyruvate dehydrogenase complex
MRDNLPGATRLQIKGEPLRKVSSPRPSMADKIYDRLLEDIISGVYALNSRLPPEAPLAVEMGVSRPVLRNALARLRDDGIITSQRGSGNYVARRPNQSVMEFVPLGSITDIQRCYEFRIDVESTAAYWAAKRRNDDDLAAMETAYAQIDKKYAVQDLGVEADLALHAAVANATRNPNYKSVLAALGKQISVGMNLSRSLTLTSPPERNVLVQAEHRKLIDAIRAQDAEAAQKAMHDHLSQAWERMFVG